jgi:hypothetical protein
MRLNRMGSCSVGAFVLCFSDIVQNKDEDWSKQLDDIERRLLYYSNVCMF